MSRSGFYTKYGEHMKTRFDTLAGGLEANELRDSAHFFALLTMLVSGINTIVAACTLEYPWLSAAIAAAGTIMTYIIVPCMSEVSAFSTAPDEDLLDASVPERIRIALSSKAARYHMIAVWAALAVAFVVVAILT